MKHRPLLLYRYAVPFRSPFRNATGTLEKREGFLLGNGSDIWTEIAPLPGFSGESIEDSGSFLNKNKELISQHYLNKTLAKFLGEETQSSGLDQFPSIRFGLSMLDEQQKAIASGLPLFSFWRNKWFPGVSETITYVHCNALAQHEDIGELAQIIHFRKEMGFRTIKVKLPADADKSYNIIVETCTRFPDVIFRFDANRAFSMPEAKDLFKRLKTSLGTDQTGNNLQYIEEPLENPDVQSFAELREYGISVAADESARTQAEVRLLTDNGCVDCLVIKPMLFGSFGDMEDLIQSSLSVTVSSVFETAIGRMLLAHIAALFNTNRETDHGLATGPFLTNDVKKSSQGPHIKFKTKPGIGIKPNIHQPWINSVEDFNKK